MKTAIFAAIAAAAIATPALAQSDMAEGSAFTGPRIGVTTGYDKFQGHDGVTYGVDAGYDLAVTPKIRAGIDVGLADSTAKTDAVKASRDLSASARIGYVVTPKIMPYAKVGYVDSRFENRDGSGTGAGFEGVRYGAGLEVAPTPRTYISAEYQRTEYEAGIGGRDAAMVGMGLRF
ncbi:MAG TPA: porin family protein [Sphingobium sp.]|uniref:porin family protein n=1 Tax=Sphingobium sp. TaxID=1912891 RepID=UPI002ED19AE9